MGALPAGHALPSATTYRRAFVILDQFLDSAASGPLYLRRPEIAGMLVDAIRYRDGIQHDLHHFVVMPNHVHAIVWFPADDQITEFVKEWKKRSSVQIKRLLRTSIAAYGRAIDPDEPVWQAGFYDSNIYSSKKLRQKLEYMHNNPVAKGLVARATDWPWSSARHYADRRSVGVPICWLD